MSFDLAILAELQADAAREARDLQDVRDSGRADGMPSADMDWDTTPWSPEAEVPGFTNASWGEAKDTWSADAK